MQSQVNEIDPVTVELTVEVPWARIQKGLDAGYGKLQKTAKVKGFRPGKVPRNVLKQLFGRQVQNEVVATLVEEGLLEAVQEHELAIVASPQVDSIPTIRDGEPFSFRAKLEIRPKVGEVVTEGLVLKKPAGTVSDAEIDAAIERLREEQADLETPDPMRPAEARDLLTIDYKVEIDAEEKADMAADGRVVELGVGKLLPEFEEALLGKQPGDEVQIRVAYGDDAAKEELRGKRALFRVNVRELKQKVLPELDDEFAQDLGEHQTLAELRDKTRAELEKAAEERVKGSLREQVVEQLLEKNAVPVPPSLVSQQEQAMRQELSFLMRMSGQTNQSLFEGELGETLRIQAEKKVRAAIVMGELARNREIKVEPSDVEARLHEIAAQTGKHIAKVRVEMTGERREALENKILEDKLLDYLLGQATVTEASPEEEPVTEEGGERAG